MKRVLPVILLLCTLPVAAQTEAPFQLFKPETHPQWVKDLRRGEIVAFGSFPFTMFASIFIMDSVRFLSHNVDTRYAPWPFKPAGAVAMTDVEKGVTVSVAVAASVIIAVVDHLIVRHKRKQAESEKPRDEAIIIRTPLYWSP
ncbi:MAG: hypothetical protein LBO67_08055 [Spirochaetaceae bacterium]|jgi:hypothetical protein|nr:hypothetical protein [Spirochaetaceae bacterium]